jgi:hypothetical protein
LAAEEEMAGLLAVAAEEGALPVVTIVTGPPPGPSRPFTCSSSDRDRDSGRDKRKGNG